LVHPFDAIQGRLIGGSFVAIGKTNRAMKVTPVGSHNSCGRSVLLMGRTNTTVVGTPLVMLDQPLPGTFRNSITTKLSPFKVMFSVIPPDDNFIIAMSGATFLQINFVTFSDYPCWYPAQANRT
jgi:hypothetical protein